MSGPDTLLVVVAAAAAGSLVPDAVDKVVGWCCSVPCWVREARWCRIDWSGHLTRPAPRAILMVMAVDGPKAGGGIGGAWYVGSPGTFHVASSFRLMPWQERLLADLSPEWRQAVHAAHRRAIDPDEPP